MEQFLKQFHQEIIEEYSRYIRRDKPPKTGSILQSLRAGFGGLGGEMLTVNNINEKYIELKNNLNKEIYLSTCDRWWQELKIISEVK